MQALYKIKSQLCDELEDISRQGDVSRSGLDMVHKLTDTIKNIDKIIMLEENDGYSGNSSYNGRGMRDGGRSYNYSQGDYSSRRGGGRRGGYSRDGAKDDMIEQLEETMNETDNPKIRDIMNHCVKILKEM